MKRTKILLAALAAIVLVGLWYTPGKTQQQNVNTLMKRKLSHAQKVLEGITTEDYDAMAKHAKDLSALSQAAAWQVFQTPEYQYHSARFRQIADSMAKNAEEKNLDGAALDYVRMTMSCVECHKYVRGARVAELEDAELPRLSLEAH